MEKKSIITNLQVELCEKLLQQVKIKLQAEDEEERLMFGLLFSYSYSTLKNLPNFDSLNSLEIEALYSAILEIKKAIQNETFDIAKFKTAITIYQTLTNQKQIVAQY